MNKPGLSVLCFPPLSPCALCMIFCGKKSNVMLCSTRFIFSKVDPNFTKQDRLWIFECGLCCFCKTKVCLQFIFSFEDNKMILLLFNNRNISLAKHQYCWGEFITVCFNAVPHYNYLQLVSSDVHNPWKTTHFLDLQNVFLGWWVDGWM